MYYVCKPTKIQIYVNSNWKTMTEIQKELGCDVLINGGLFDGSFKPCCWLRVDGQTLHDENWSDWGYGWDSNTFTMDTSVNLNRYKNFITCVALVREGTPINPLIYSKALGGRRGRTALGVRKDGSVIVYCTQDGGAYSSTPEELRDELYSLGATTALMLDGGQSSRCILPTGNIPSNKNRPYVANYIAIWTKPIAAPLNPVNNNPQCPYKEPMHTVGRWCFFYTKDEARWVQWMLNQNGYNLDIDGSFGKLSDAALRKYQVSQNLDPDGKCGPLTRDAFMGRNKQKG